MNFTCRRGATIFLAAILCVSQKITISAQSKVATNSIVISKSAHTLTLMSGKTVLKTYHVALGRGSTGAKQVAGDNRTPEGRYVIDEKTTSTKFHKALHISYPNEEDRARALKLGTTQHVMDWTAGCIALSNDEIDELWKIVSVGTLVEIYP